MLEAYKKKYQKNNFQYLIVNSDGKIIETEKSLIDIELKSQIQDIHPFFESIVGLLSDENQIYEFSCVNLDLPEKSLIVDIYIHTESKDQNVLIIENLTKHYNNYQLTAQNRNESVINYQVLELKNEYLKEKEQFKNNFIANFSHQLRNPITASSIFSTLLNNTNLNSEQKNYLDIILSANKDLKNRIEDILDTAKIDSGKLILTETVFSLTDLLHEIESGYRVLATKQNLNFNITIDEKTPQYIIGDAYRLKQIIGNLLNNAISFTKKGSITLKVSLNFHRANRANLQIEVSDTGIGIDKIKQADIFERFNKVESNKTNNRNIGLGLSIVKYLVQQMNGNISIKSSLNEGTAVFCNISFVVAKETKKIAKQTINYPKLEKKKNILLVEDSELIQLSILKILSSDGNFFVNIVTNGEDVITSIVDQDVDLVLVSNSIQRHTAENIAMSIRNLPKEFKKTPILALSSEVFKEDIKRYKKSGINDVISKPFDKESLLSKLYKYAK